MRGGLRGIDIAATVFIVVALLVLATLLREERIAGNAFAVDGDTLAVDGRRVRLKGLDAPEMSQTCQRAGGAYRCGEEARAALRAVIAGQAVSCLGRNRDRYERLLATCTVRGADIGADLVRRGLAVSFGGYAAEEREARAERRGVWAGPFETPQAWRRRHAEERS